MYTVHPANCGGGGSDRVVQLAVLCCVFLLAPVGCMCCGSLCVVESAKISALRGGRAVRDHEREREMVGLIA